MNTLAWPSKLRCDLRHRHEISRLNSQHPQVGDGFDRADRGRHSVRRRRRDPIEVRIAKFVNRSERRVITTGFEERVEMALSIAVDEEA